MVVGARTSSLSAHCAWRGLAWWSKTPREVNPLLPADADADGRKLHDDQLPLFFIVHPVSSAAALLIARSSRTPRRTTLVLVSYWLLTYPPTLHPSPRRWWPEIFLPGREDWLHGAWPRPKWGRMCQLVWKQQLLRYSAYRRNTLVLVTFLCCSQTPEIKNTIRKVHRTKILGLHVVRYASISKTLNCLCF